MTPKSTANIRGWFDVLETTDRSQVAMMILEAGTESGREPEAHPVSDQVMLVTEGSVTGTIAGREVTLQTGEFVTIPAGVLHRFWNEGVEKAVTFNVYAAPAYPADCWE